MDPLHDLLQDKFTDLPEFDLPVSTSPTTDHSTKNEVPVINPTDNTETLQKPQLDSIRKKLYEIKTQLNDVIRTVDALSSASLPAQPSIDIPSYQPQVSSGMQIEGVFTGSKMIGADGKEYDMSPNYASKSKLVEGDLLKLTITPQGKFFYKQIGPVKRTLMQGEAWYDTDLHQWFIVHQQERYKLLLACATFYKLVPGQIVTVLVPEEGGNTWTTIERI